MSRKNAGLLTGFGVALALSGVARGDETADKVSRLESLLDSQQRLISELEQQVAAQDAQGVDAMRTEAMRQQIREILSDAEFRESLMPSTMLAGYDKGFYIKSSDDLFQLKVNGYSQFRWTHYGTQSRNRYRLPRLERNDRTGFDVQRLRLILSGHAWSRDLTYHLQLRADAPDGYDFVVHWAFVNYRFADELQFAGGIFKAASSRSQLTSESGFQFIDRSMTDTVMSFGNVLGARLWGQLFDKKVEYFVDVVNSLSNNTNRTITPDPAEHDNNPAILGRLVWHALGDDPAIWRNEGDLPKSESPQLDFGFVYAFNDDQGDRGTTRIPFPANRRSGIRGGYGLTNTNGLQINQFSFDSAFKWQGFSATGEYFLRIVDPRRAFRAPFTPYSLLTGETDTVTYHGAYVQLGYFLPIPGLEDKIEAVARVGGISAMGNGREGSWEYGGGLNYYIKGHAVKLQTDVVKIYEVPISNSPASLANVNDDALVWRVQLQVAF